ncbi:fibronectin type III domain-containing protein [Amycolatopsis nigrescens]|uniref:fibronectin type III domain-containing protein n=1 Tax=Amycolatopsis nigrescens TaxID=381445 RepID=UPI0003712065|nr:fibronectin type III domain-containing protein [Amycolatopsis nigrescens]
MRLATALLALVLAGCSAAPVPAERLSSTLVSPVDIELHWQGDDPGAAGRVVEFATEPQGDYTVLEYLPTARTTFRHPDLIPETTFYHRIRAYYGPVSNTVEVVLPPGEFTEEDQRNDHEWAPPKVIPGGTAAKHAVRSADPAAAPAGLTATVMHANGIRFGWADNAGDEDGYLLESRPAGGGEFGVTAVLDPDVNSFGLITLPNEKRAEYRVRAYYYGPSSNVVHHRTGRE